MRTYVIPGRILARLKTLGLDLRCPRCQVEIKTGDRVVTMGKGYYGSHKFYHEACYKETVIDPEKERKIRWDHDLLRRISKACSISEDCLQDMIIRLSRDLEIDLSGRGTILPNREG